ncbi:DUF1501 domain-containing protein [Vibrio sp. TRT 17S01]|uniref:DUF1501 domain-containing protein n=1 Tax=Vibrio sp. TRT 17S01 TaxID=3418505 RepID=UPI003CF59625
MSISRRTFLRSIAAASLIPHVGWANGSTSDDYKALVCVFLGGGNDGFNTLVPTSEEHYQAYSNARKHIAIKHHELLPTSLQAADRDGVSLDLGLHPSMAALKPLFDKGYVNAVLNCGVLKQPMSKEQTDFAPYELFSHNSQSAEWLKGDATNHEAYSGWGARLMTHLATNSSNTPPLYSFAGKTKLYQGINNINVLPTDRTSTLRFSNDRLKESFINTLEQHGSSDLHNHFRNIMRDSLSLGEATGSILQTHGDPELANYSGMLSKQLNAVFKFIQHREMTNQNRQIFYVNLSGFDTHANQKAEHSRLLKELSVALAEFYNALDNEGLSPNVTTVTMSDFGRRIVPNATGTDHGWGNNQLIINGGLAKSGTTGVWPSLEYGGPDDYSSGRLLPTTSVDQIGATLAQWMGVAPADIDKVFPNIGSFSPQLLDFI